MHGTKNCSFPAVKGILIYNAIQNMYYFQTLHTLCAKIRQRNCSWVREKCKRKRIQYLLNTFYSLIAFSIFLVWIYLSYFLFYDFSDIIVFWKFVCWYKLHDLYLKNWQKVASITIYSLMIIFEYLTQKIQEEIPFLSIGLVFQYKLHSKPFNKNNHWF